MRQPEHEKLIVYQRALNVIATLEPTLRSVPHEHAYLRLQLRRALSSIAFNIAEGAGEFSAAEKARFYRIARRSATECMSGLDVLQLVAPPRYSTSAAKNDLVEIASMLTTIVKRLPDR